MLKASKIIYIVGIITTSLAVVGLLLGSILLLIQTEDSEFIKQYARDHGTNENAATAAYISYGVMMAVLSAIGVIEVVVSAKAVYHINKDTRVRNVHIGAIVLSVLATRITPFVAAIFALIGLAKQDRIDRLRAKQLEKQEKNSA
jgi:hypothetical protein